MCYTGKHFFWATEFVLGEIQSKVSVLPKSVMCSVQMILYYQDIELFLSFLVYWPALTATNETFFCFSHTRHLNWCGRNINFPEKILTLWWLFAWPCKSFNLTLWHNVLTFFLHKLGWLGLNCVISSECNIS